MSSFRFGDYFAYRTTKAILTVMKRGVRVLKYGGRGGVGRPPACAGARPPDRPTVRRSRWPKADLVRAEGPNHGYYAWQNQAR